MNHISRRLILIIGVELREFRAWIIQRPEVFHSFILVHETGIDRGIQEIATRQNIIPERTLKEYIQGKVFIPKCITQSTKKSGFGSPIVV